MLKLAVVGKDVSKSLSPAMHTFILGKMGEECTYECVSIPPEEFSARAQGLLEQFDGFNVTIPFKTDIIPHLAGTAGDARTFGAVNTVNAHTRTGHNTDGLGFMLMLENAGLDVRDKRVLVLGAGGAGRSCIYKLCEGGARVYAYERDALRLKQVYEEFGNFVTLDTVPVRQYDVIVNCTGVGMHASVGRTPSVRTAAGEVPVGEELLSKCSAAVDLIYEPKQSEFLRVAASLGKRTVNGEAMLFYQAYYSDCIYLERTPSADEAKAYYEAYSGGEA